MKYRLIFILFAGVMLVLAGCEKDILKGPDPAIVEESPTYQEMEEFSKWGFNGYSCGSVKVMTRNIYVGSNIDTLMAAQNPSQVPELATYAFQMLLSTNFPERAESLAKEIARGRPHLIGLQEVSTIRVQHPGDAVYGGTVPAEDVLFDYLDILLSAIQARGLDYRVAGIIQNFDVEVPMVVGVNPLQFDDVRLTDYDVVLARHDVQVSRVSEVNYQMSLPLPGLGIEISRGYVALDARVRNKTYRFVNTHLKAEVDLIRMAQAQELVASLQNETLPVILVGDLDTPAPTGQTYQYLESEGLVDAWTRNLIRRNSGGFTSPHDLDLRNEEVHLYQRIDLIFVRSNVRWHGRQIIGPVLAYVVGDELHDRTPSGLWPSDHAGVVAWLKIPIAPTP